MGYVSCLEDTTRRLDDIRHDLSTLRQDLGSPPLPCLEEVRLERIASTTQALIETIDKLLEFATDPSVNLSDCYLIAQSQLKQQSEVLKGRENEIQRLSEVVRMSETQRRAANFQVKELENDQNQMVATTAQMKAQISRLGAQVAQLRLDISKKDLEIQALEKLVMPSLLASGNKNGQFKDKFR